MVQKQRMVGTKRLISAEN